MAHRIHSSARRTTLPKLTFASNFYNNPFLNRQLLQRRHSITETEDCLSTLSKDEHLEKENHIHQLGEIIIKPSKFQLVLDVIDLLPQDLLVQAFRKGFLVSAAHKETLEDGREYITNHFHREYLLPKEIEPKEATSWITTENLLFIEAPKKNQFNDESQTPNNDSEMNYEEINDLIDVEILQQVFSEHPNFIGSKYRSKWSQPLRTFFRTGKKVHCGTLSLEDTASIAFCNNRIFQFHYNLTVAIYDKALNHYSRFPDRLHLHDGWLITLESINFKITQLGNFRSRTQLLVAAYPNERHRRITMGLIRPPESFVLHFRVMLSGNRFWLVGQFNDFNYTTLVEYQVTKEERPLIPISAAYQFFMITWDLESNFLLYDGYKFHFEFGVICLGSSDKQLRLQDPDTICVNRWHVAEILSNILKPLNYGFTSFLNLILVSSEKQYVLIVNRNILKNFYTDFEYEKRNFSDFFTCSEKINRKKSSLN